MTESERNKKRKNGVENSGDNAPQSVVSDAVIPSVLPPPADDEAAGKLPNGWPNPAWWTKTALRIGGRLTRLMKDYMERNGGKMPMHIPSDHNPLNVVGESFAKLARHMAGSPENMVNMQLGFWQDYVRLCQAAVAKISGKNPEPVIAPEPNDKRFKDTAWQDVFLFDFIKQSYLLTARWAQKLAGDTDGIEPKVARKIDFYTRQMVDAIAPSNFLLTNPEVLRATVESGGENLVRGLEHLLDDIDRSGGKYPAITMSDSKAFRLGDNLAFTPGKVVFQNSLLQLIQYDPAPNATAVYKNPILIVPPWINKYYILDMREKNSFIRYLVNQGHTVFCISWVNPDARHADINFDDYMSQGLLAALAAIGDDLKVDEVNVLGYCLGGTMLACTLAWFKALKGKGHPDLPAKLPRVASATYLVTLIDFAEPGDLGVFVDEEQIEAIEARMAECGYLEGQAMATTFNLLRSNDLIWSFVVNNYLLGKEPFPFDLLYWNADSTNLPAAMQSFYLRNMYLDNKLVQPYAVSMRGVPIDVRQIDTPTFILSTRDDHIAPWRSTYAATQMYQGPVTFMLGGSGHIAGVVNPPVNNKYGYWTNPNCPPTPEDWLASAVSHEGSWWPEWMNWLKPFSGGSVAPRVPGTAACRAIEDAPGSYVRVKLG